jgi:hypothetical protein
MLAYHDDMTAVMSAIRSFGIALEPRYIFGAGSLDQ